MRTKVQTLRRPAIVFNTIYIVFYYFLHINAQYTNEKKQSAQQMCWWMTVANHLTLGWRQNWSLKKVPLPPPGSDLGFGLKGKGNQEMPLKKWARLANVLIPTKDKPSWTFTCTASNNNTAWPKQSSWLPPTMQAWRWKMESVRWCCKSKLDMERQTFDKQHEMPGWRFFCIPEHEWLA